MLDHVSLTVSDLPRAGDLAGAPALDSPRRRVPFGATIEGARRRVARQETHR
jgi:hypothetical protein